MGDYKKKWTTNNPGFIGFLLDCSGSTVLEDASGYSLVERIQMGANSGIFSSLTRNISHEGVKNKAVFTTITYGGGGAKIVSKKSIADFATEGDSLPTQTIPTSVGDIETPQFIPSLTASGSTPMAAGFDLMHQAVEEFCKANPDAAAPIIIHVTDGMPNDSAAAIAAAKRCGKLSTTDGSVLLFNLHISTNSGNKVLFPSSESELSDPAARLLYSISDILPPSYLVIAKTGGLSVKENSRMMTQNGNGEDIAQIINFGSSVADDASLVDVNSDTFNY